MPAEDWKGWRCKRCGSDRPLSVSLNGGYERMPQCVPCGWLDGSQDNRRPGWKTLELTRRVHHAR